MQHFAKILGLVKGGWGPLAIATLLLVPRYLALPGSTDAFALLATGAITLCVIAVLAGLHRPIGIAAALGAIVTTIVVIQLRRLGPDGISSNSLWLVVPLMCAVIEVWLILRWWMLHSAIKRPFPHAKYLVTLVGLSMTNTEIFNYICHKFIQSSIITVVFSGFSIDPSPFTKQLDGFIESYPNLQISVYGILLLVSTVVATAAGETKLAELRESWSTRRSIELNRFQEEMMRPRSHDQDSAHVEHRVHTEFIRTIHGVAVAFYSFWLVIREIPGLLIAVIHDLITTFRTNIMASLLLLLDAVTSFPAAIACGALLFVATISLLGHLVGVDPVINFSAGQTLLWFIGSLLYLALIAEFRQIIRVSIAPKDLEQRATVVFSLRFFVTVFAIIPAAIGITAAAAQMFLTVGFSPKAGSHQVMTWPLWFGLSIVLCGLTVAMVLGFAAVIRASGRSTGGHDQELHIESRPVVTTVRLRLTRAGDFVSKHLASLQASAGRTHDDD